MSQARISLSHSGAASGSLIAQECEGDAEWPEFPLPGSSSSPSPTSFLSSKSALPWVSKVPSNKQSAHSLNTSPKHSQS